ncbi:MAG: IclR family transcriptional regulator [Planctomycetota bacterium]
MVQVLKKADNILELVASKDEPMIFTEISTSLHIHKATLSHILKTLLEVGLLEKTEKGRYQIGPKVMQLSRKRRRKDLLLDLAEENARALAEEIREVVTVGALLNGERYNLAKASVDQVITVGSQMEHRPLPYETATGRVLLAWLDEDALEEVIAKKGLPGSAWPEIRSKKELTQALKAIRKAEIACWHSPDGEAEAAAVPIIGPDGRAWAAIGAILPSYRSDGGRRESVIAGLRVTAKRMSCALALRLDDWTASKHGSRT